MRNIVALNVLDTVSRWCALICSRIAAISLALMTTIIAVELIVRGVFKTSMGIMEIPAYLFGATVFLALAESFRQNLFIRVDLIYERLSKRTRPYVELVLLLAALVFLVFMCRELTKFVLESFQRGEKSMALLRTPLFIPQSILAVGTYFLGLELLAETGKTVRKLFGSGE